jgi:hypothetical protein
VHQRERERGVAAGERRQMEIGGTRRRRANGIYDDHLAGRLWQPVLVLVRSRGRRVGSPDEDRGGVARGARIEAVEGRAVDVVERDVTGLVANRVRVDLGRAEAVEEALREVVAEQRERAGVVGVENRVRPGIGLDRGKPLRDLGDRLVPRDLGRICAGGRLPG